VASHDDDPARTQSSRMVWQILDGTALAAGADFFPALVRTLATTLRVQYAFVAACTDASRTRVRTLAFWNRDRLAENVEYALAGTPCHVAVSGDVSFHPERVQERFPEDHDLIALGVQSYLGVPLTGVSGDVLGHLAILDVEPMQEDAIRSMLLRTFATRAGMELERLRAADEIATLNQRLAIAADRSRSLLAINNAVVLNLTQDALFHAITAALRPVIHFDRMTIFLHDERKNGLRMVVAESGVPSAHFVHDPAERKLGRLSVLHLPRVVKFVAILQPANIVAHNSLAHPRAIARAYRDIVNFQP
jgi:GAF domain-containing protein